MNCSFLISQRSFQFAVTCGGGSQTFLPLTHLSASLITQLPGDCKDTVFLQVSSLHLAAQRLTQVPLSSAHLELFLLPVLPCTTADIFLSVLTHARRESVFLGCVAQLIHWKPSVV